jgi:hypothetical protein
VLLTVAKSSIDLNRVDQAPMFVAVEPVPAFVSCTAAESVRGELLPPPDLVVTLGVMLI